jgi:hypothetical protein
MKEAGCRFIYVGVESADNGILAHMRKGVTVEHAVGAVNLIRKHGIRLRANFVIGTPWETEQTLNETFAAMKAIKGEFAYSIFTPYPGTEAFDYCKSAGLITNDYDPALHNHQSPENSFSLKIGRERFRELASKIEDYVDMRNTQELLKRSVLSPRTTIALHGGLRPRLFLNAFRAAASIANPVRTHHSTNATGRLQAKQSKAGS